MVEGTACDGGNCLWWRELLVMEGTASDGGNCL